MITKNVKYNNVDGEACEDKVYFNLTLSEAMDMEFAESGRLSRKLMNIENADDGEQVNLVQDLILSAYGEKSEDGKRLVKNAEIRENFKQSLVYDALLRELIANPDEARKFIEALIPDSAGKTAQTISTRDRDLVTSK